MCQRLVFQGKLSCSLVSIVCHLLTHAHPVTARHWNSRNGLLSFRLSHAPSRADKIAAGATRQWGKSRNRIHPRVVRTCRKLLSSDLAVTSSVLSTLIFHLFATGRFVLLRCDVSLLTEDSLSLNTPNLASALHRNFVQSIISWKCFYYFLYWEVNSLFASSLFCCVFMLTNNKGIELHDCTCTWTWI